VHYLPKESSLKLTMWVPFVQVLSFTLLIVRDFPTPKTRHWYCGGGGGRIFQNGWKFKSDELLPVFYES